jgi:uncharacterized protein (TIRG00374 family)
MSKSDSDQTETNNAAPDPGPDSGSDSGLAPKSASGWKRGLMIGLRLLVAAAGIGYVVSSLTWSDQVQIAAGTKLSTGYQLTEKTSFLVIEGMIDPAAPPSNLTIEAPDAKGQLSRLVVTVKNQLSDQYRANQGIKTMLSNAQVSYLIWGFLLIGFIYPMQAIRWGLLMRARGLETTIWKRFRLIMVGAFFNFCMPGMTGGDLIKAYYAAKNSDRRTDAVMSVIFDRIAGLIALILLAGFAGLFWLQDEVARWITLGIWLGLAAMACGAFVFFNIPMRNRLGISWILRGLPAQKWLLKIDDAATAYGNHKGALAAATAITIPVHLATVTAAVLAGYALGMRVPLGLAVTKLPIVFLSGAVPLTYQGLGVMEWLGRHLLVDPPIVYFNQLVGLLLFYRLYQVVYGVLGSVFLLGGDIHLHPEQDAKAADSVPSQTAEAEVDQGN